MSDESVREITIPEDAPEAPRVSRLASVEAPPRRSLENDPEAAEDTSSEPSDPSPEEDIERLLPSPGEPFQLASGDFVILNDLKLKGFLAMLKIVTRGAALALSEVRLNVNDEAFGESLMTLFLFAIPEAEAEAADFLRVMIRPAGPFEDQDARQQAEASLDAQMMDPDLEDVFTIIGLVIRNEGSDLRRLGKRLTSAMAFAQKTGQV